MLDIVDTPIMYDKGDLQSIPNHAGEGKQPAILLKRDLLDEVQIQSLTRGLVNPGSIHTYANTDPFSQS